MSVDGEKIIGSSMKQLFVFIFFISAAVFAQENQWVLNEVQETVNTEPNVQLTASVLNFVDAKKKTITFKPTTPPFIMVSSQQVQIEKTTFFITSWAYGSATVQFKIFSPQVSQLPLCQEISDGEETELRVKNGILELKIFKIKNDKELVQWVRCTDRWK
jgi:hypothetical protein